MRRKLNLLLKEIKNLNEFQRIALWEFRFPDKPYISEDEKEELKKELTRIRVIKSRKTLSNQTILELREKAKTDNHAFIECIASDYLIVPKHKVKELAMLTLMNSLYTIPDNILMLNIKGHLDAETSVRLIKRSENDMDLAEVCHELVRCKTALASMCISVMGIGKILSPFNGIDNSVSIYTENNTQKHFSIFRER